MSEHAHEKRGTSPIAKSTVVSEEGAAIRVERFELSDAMRQSLTIQVKSIGSFRPGGSGLRGDRE